LNPLEVDDFSAISGKLDETGNVLVCTTPAQTKRPARGRPFPVWRSFSVFGDHLARPNGNSSEQ
jgi:hypothetical protein